MGINFKFDVNILEHDIKKCIEKDIKKHPEQFLNNHRGKSLSTACPKCGKNNLKIISGGKAKCGSCNIITNIDIDINWK